MSETRPRSETGDFPTERRHDVKPLSRPLSHMQDRLPCGSLSAACHSQDGLPAATLAAEGPPGSGAYY